MGNVQMEARQIRYGSTNVEEALKEGGGTSELAERVTALETTVGDETGGLVKDVDDLEATVSELYPNVYSTTETKIGKWGTDDLYRLKIDIASLPNNTLSYFGDAINNIDVKRVYGVTKSVNYSLPLPYSDVVASNAVQVYFDYGQHKVAIKTAIDYRAFTGEVVIEYTKINENNR